jgi:hypothetical protein
MYMRLAALATVLATPIVAAPCDTAPEGTYQLATAKLYVEDNAGDGDIGVHGAFDDHGWKELCVFSPDGDLVLHVRPDGALGSLGIAGIFFESLEPEYADFDYAALTSAFPEGDYTVRGTNWDGQGLMGAAHFTTLVPLPPTILEPATAPEADEGPLPGVPVADLTVSWEPVTASRDDRIPVIRGYQVTVVKENYEDPNGFSQPIYDIHVGPETTAVVVPAAFFDPASVYELEVLAIEESGNQTIGGASFFATR